MVRTADIKPGPGKWINRAACQGADTSIFFPGQGDDYREPKAICAGCPVQSQCLEYALSTSEVHGIWGGKSERERKAIRRSRLIARRNSKPAPLPRYEGRRRMDHDIIPPPDPSAAPLCACGCGQPVRWNVNGQCWSRWQRGHHTRGVAATA